MTRLFLPDGLETDLSRVLQLDEATLTQIAELMDTEAGVGGAVPVARRLAEETGIPAHVANLAEQIARFLGRQKRECRLSEDEVVNELVAVFPGLADELNRQRTALIALLSEKSTAERLRKKDRLSRGVVKTLVDIDGYCDLRPIFDSNRQRIVDQVRVVLVRMQLEDDLGDDESIVLQLNEDSLKELEDFLAMTRKKLVSLSEFYPTPSQT